MHLLQHACTFLLGVALPVLVLRQFFFYGEGVPENWGAGHEENALESVYICKLRT